MKQVPNFNLGGKANRHHRRMMAKNQNLAAAVKGTIRVQANGSLLVTVPCVDGSVVTYAAHPFIEWRFR